MTTVLTIIFWASTWGALAYLVGRHTAAAFWRRERERRELERCGGVIRPINAVRRDPPPRPPGRAA